MNNPLDQEVLSFLKDLAAHNNKDWLDEHRGRYHQQKEKVIQFTDHLYRHLTEIEALPLVNPKKSLTRINNNRKFHPDKPPYKTHFGLMIKRGERRSEFYLHLDPAGCFIGAGLYHPPRDILEVIRYHIHRTGGELSHIVEQPAFQQKFGGLHGDSLKTAPRDFPRDHPQIEFIRRKDFVVMQDYKDADMLSDQAFALIVESYRAALPLMQFIDAALAEEG